ncbi:MAG TPA: hypothetical protein VIN61_06150 [Gammaproteobacteria bacterium]
MSTLRSARGALATGTMCVLLGCASSQVLVAHRVPLVAADEAVDEDRLLDVAVVVFDPGVPPGEIHRDDLEKLREDGVFVHVRRVESIQMAAALRDTLASSGHWGSVWITPQSSLAADVNVVAKILESDGYVVRVEAEVVDAAGRVWIGERYELETAAAAYRRERHSGLDPYQDLFTSIANDMAAALGKLSPAEIGQLKAVGALRYAAEFSPEAFGSYVVREKDGDYRPVRLPALDDPVFEGALNVRRREGLFFDTLDLHYERLVADAQPSYDSWREIGREESITIRELTRGARVRTGLGIVAMLGSLLYGGGNSAFVQNGMVAVGGELLGMREETLRGRELHAAALAEVSQSYDDEVAPMVVDIAGVEHRLTGTAAVQYAELRELLRQQLLDETGTGP